MDIERLNWMYTKSGLTMDAVAAAHGLKRRQMTLIISQFRKQEPDKWPKRNGKPPLTLWRKERSG